MSSPAKYILHTAVPDVFGAAETGAPIRPRCRAQANVTIAAPGATVDGLAMVAGEEFWTDLQSTGSQDGLYVWTGAATPATRSTKLPAGVDAAGLIVVPMEGTDADQVVLVTNNLGAGVVGTDGLTGSLPLVTLTGTQRVTNKTFVSVVDTVDSGATGATDVVVGRTTRRTTGTLVGNGGAGVGLRDVFTAPSSTGVERLAGGVEAGLDTATNAAERGYTALLGGYAGTGYGVLYVTAPAVVVNAVEVIGGATGVYSQITPRGEANSTIRFMAKGTGALDFYNPANTTRRLTIGATGMGFWGAPEAAQPAHLAALTVTETTDFSIAPTPAELKTRLNLIENRLNTAIAALETPGFFAAS